MKFMVENGEVVFNHELIHLPLIFYRVHMAQVIFLDSFTLPDQP